MAKLSNRKKVNFMIDENIIFRIEKVVTPGSRSDFVNSALDDALNKYSRAKASEEIDNLRDSMNLEMTTKELLKLKNYGRE